MERADIMKALEEIFQDVFGDESLTIQEHMNSSDIEEWDSLTHISILAAVQDEFHVSFNIDEITAMKNVGDMVTAIEEKL